MNNHIREKQIISVRMLGDVAVSCNSLEEGIIFKDDIFKNVIINGIKYYIQIDDKKIFFKWNVKNNVLTEPTPEQFKKIVGTT